MTEQPTKDDIVKELLNLRTQMITQLGDEYVAGMNQAFDICIAGLEKSATNPQIATSKFGPGIAIAVDTLKSLRGEAIAPFIEENRNALKTLNNTALFETPTGETNNG